MLAPAEPPGGLDGGQPGIGAALPRRGRDATVGHPALVGDPTVQSSGGHATRDCASGLLIRDQNQTKSRRPFLRAICTTIPQQTDPTPSLIISLITLADRGCQCRVLVVDLDPRGLDRAEKL